MSKFLEVLSGARLSNEIGHRLQQWGVPTTWASNIGTALAPTVMPHHLTSYYAARQRGMDTTDARQFATNDAFRTAAAAAAVYGGVEAAGAYGGGGASGLGANGAGAGFSGVGSEGSLLGGTQMGAGGLYSGVGQGVGGGSLLGGGSSFTPLAGSQAGIGLGSSSGFDFTKLGQNALKGYANGQQKGQQGTPNSADTSLLAYLLALRDQQQSQAQPAWTQLT